MSTVDYYSHINRLTNERLGGDSSARLVLYSLNLADVVANNDKNDLELNYSLVLEACQTLKVAGAQGLVICANTLNMYAERIAEATGLPVIHIAEATAEEIVLKGCKKVVLLGTKYTMEMDFYRSKLEGAGITVVTPDSEDRKFVHETIFQELGKGIFDPKTKNRYLRIIGNVMNEGADGVVLACTEIPLLIKPEDLDVPVFDTTLIHSKAAVCFALS